MKICLDKVLKLKSELTASVLCPSTFLSMMVAFLRLSGDLSGKIKPQFDVAVVKAPVVQQR